MNAQTFAPHTAMASCLGGLLLLCGGCAKPGSPSGAETIGEVASACLGDAGGAAGGATLPGTPAPVATMPQDVSADLPCSPGVLSLTITPLTPRGHEAQTTAVYDVAVANLDSGACDPRLLLFEAGSLPAGFSRFVAPSAFTSPPGTTTDFFFSLTASTDAIAGDYPVSVAVLDAVTGGTLTGSVDYSLLASTGCFVKPPRELFITDRSVVEDPVRTGFGGAPEDSRAAAWSFGRLMERVAPTPGEAPAFVENLFDSWLVDQPINGFTVAARPSMAPFLLDEWPRLPDGSLDLARAPLRLLGIMNRMDLRSLANGNAGQGRFIFGVLNAAGQTSPFTLIVEYSLQARSELELLQWAGAWHDLGSLPFPSEAYNAHLQAITDRFSGRGANPYGVNQSALATVRTNEFALGGPWELREFKLAADGLLHPVPVDMTPDLGFLGTPTLARFVNGNEPAILNNDFTVPLDFAGGPFLGGSALNLGEPWTAPGIRSPLARRTFSLATCNGCHSIPETGVEFLQLRPRDVGAESELSAFLLGAAVPDPVDGELYIVNDLLRRKTDLEALACSCVPDRCEPAWVDLHRCH